MVPRDFYIFKALNKNVRGRPFVTNEKSEDSHETVFSYAGHAFFNSFFFFNSGKCYDNYTNVLGGYVEK